MGALVETGRESQALDLENGAAVLGFAMGLSDACEKAADARIIKETTVCDTIDKEIGPGKIGGLLSEG